VNGATKSMAQKAGDTAWRARDKAEHKAREVKHRASSKTGITRSDGMMRAKGTQVRMDRVAYNHCLLP
jgi:hypothetical protein